jgi:ArsR family transcriptional regulator
MILYALTECTCNVSDLARRVGLPQPTVSRHLKILRERGLVEARRDAQSVYYKVSDDRIIQALDMLRAVMTDRLTDRATLVRTARETLFS